MEEITRNQETNQILIKDKLHFEDKLVYANSNGPQAKPHGMWARTEVIGGFGDFVRGRRTTEERLVRNNITPTLKDAVPGDLSLVFPYRIMKDIEEMIYALDEVTPGMASDETLLYGVEVKFYSNKILTNKDFETNIKGLRAIGDGASVTRGLQQASANGLSVAKSILNK